ncbi:MAG: MotA/TolQ/ExbB proton channel family protein, partial [Lachnospiraceae bacterium]|nr:MotA/TolQ/ExbB proton channel family protein [Lachnospiraceae bacterium]
ILLNARRIISVVTAVLAVGICVFITYISRDVEITSLAINLGFLAVMLIAILASFFTGLLRLMNISKALGHGADFIHTLVPDGETRLPDGFFENEFLDKCYAEYHDMEKKHPDGSCDICDFINEDVIETYIHRSLLELIPDILASLGILGTFIGLVLGLRNFDPSGYEQMADSVSPLIDGIKVAFVTSIYGLALSLPFSFNLRSELSEMANNLDRFTDTFYLYVRPSHEVDSAARLLEQKKSQEDLTNDLTQIFVEQMSKSFEMSITPAFGQMTSAINQIVDSFTQRQEESVAQICGTIINDLHADLDDSFRRISQSAKQLEKTQSSYMDFMDRSMSRLQQTFTDLQNHLEKSEQYNEQTLSRLTQAQQEAFRINEEQKATYQEYIRFMYQSIEKYSDVWEENSARLQNYSDEIAKMGPVQSNLEIRKDLTGLSEQIKTLSKQQAVSQELSASLEESEQLLQDMMKKLTQLEKQTAEPVLFRRKNKR